MLDEPLYDPRLGLTEFMAGAQRAADARMAAVVVPTSRVALAAYAVSGSAVRVSVAPALDLGPEAASSTAEVLRASERVLQDGATELGLLATPDQLEPSGRRAFAAQIRAVAGIAVEFAAVVKVILPVSGVSKEIARMRRALGEETVLKWTAPVSDLDRLLIACAEGADRFNADATTVLRQASERARTTELRIPEAPTDY